MALQAIPTRYNGRLFRSRIEARWAYFFDQMGWEWEYEQEGYILDSGWYLPDFKFEQWGIFAEVKPVQLNAEEMQKCVDLSLDMDSTKGSIDVLLLEGLPKNKAYRTIIDGQIGTPVLFLSKDQKHYPFFSSDEFIDEWTMLSDTVTSVRLANEHKFKKQEANI